MWQHIVTIALMILITVFSLWAFLQSYSERKRSN